MNVLAKHNVYIAAGVRSVRKTRKVEVNVPVSLSPHHHSFCLTINKSIINYGWPVIGKLKEKWNQLASAHLRYTHAIALGLWINDRHDDGEQNSLKKRGFTTFYSELFNSDNPDKWLGRHCKWLPTNRAKDEGGKITRSSPSPCSINVISFRRIRWCWLYHKQSEKLKKHLQHWIKECECVYFMVLSQYF